MSAPSFDVGGVKVEVRSLPAAVELLRGFPPGPVGPPGLVLAPGASAPPNVDGGGARPSFFHASLRCLVHDGVFVLRDHATALTISADGRRIEAAFLSRTDEGASELALLVALVVALRHHGLFHLHAAALEGPDACRVLVVGTSGAGKTTLALALAAAGLKPLGDDAALLGQRDGATRVVGFPRPFHVAARTAAAFPALARHLGAPGLEGKRPVDVRAVLEPHPSGTMGPPTLLVLPEVTSDDETTAEPLSRAGAFGALLESSALAVAEAMPAVAEHLALLGTIADGARCLRVRLGADLLRTPAACASRLIRAGDEVPRTTRTLPNVREP